MFVKKQFITGNIQIPNWNSTSKFSFAFDLENEILHLHDDGEHRSKSLINAINSRLRDFFVTDMKHEGFKIDVKRCFIYQDGSEKQYQNEYVFEKETSHPFIPIADKSFMYEPFVK